MSSNQVGLYLSQKHFSRSHLRICELYQPKNMIIQPFDYLLSFNRCSDLVLRSCINMAVSVSWFRFHDVSKAWRLLVSVERADNTLR